MVLVASFFLNFLTPNVGYSVLLTDVLTDIVSDGKYDDSASEFWDDLNNDSYGCALFKQITCAILIPVCIFNDSTSNKALELINEKPMSKEVLQALSYSESDINLLLAEQDKFKKDLKVQEVQLVIEKNETLKSLTDGMQKVSPDLNKRYISFVAERMGILL